MKALKSSEQKLAFVYCRVSTKKQEDNNSLKSQETACRKLAESLGYAVSVYKEIYSGAELWDRKVLSHVRSEIKAGKCQALIVHDIDRLSREPVHQFIIGEECERADCELRFVLEPPDDSDEGQLIRYVKGYAAKIEREKIKERMMRGKHTRLLSGKVPAFGSDLFGYRRDNEKGIRFICEPEAQVVRRIFQMFNEGYSIAQLERILNAEGVPSPGAGRTYATGNAPAWSRTGIRRLLNTRAYMGEMIVWQQATSRERGKRHIRQRDASETIKLPEGVCPAIVSAEVFEEAQARLADNPRHYARAKTRNEGQPLLLRGLVYCLDCGRPMYPIQGGSRRKLRYRCSSRYNYFHRQQCKGASCDATKVETRAWKQIQDIMSDPDMILRELRQTLNEKADSHVEGDLKTLQEQLRTLEGGQQRLVKQLMTASDNIAKLIERELQATEVTRQRLIKEIEFLSARANAQKRRQIDLESLAEYCSRVQGVVNAFNFEERRLLVETLKVQVKAKGDVGLMSWKLPTGDGGVVELQTY
jgi:site-specific DNA recombinase